MTFGHKPRLKGYAIDMRHVSMLPPQRDQPYRARHEERKRRWEHLEKVRQEHEMAKAVNEFMRNWREEIVIKAKAKTRRRWWHL